MNARKFATYAALFALFSAYIGTWHAPRAQAAPISVYVSPTGSDTTGNGSSGSPYKTVQKARDAVRAAIAGGMSGDATVYLKGGEYVTEQIVLNASDSGRNGYKVIYRNAPGETPVLNNGAYITGWQQVAGKPYYKTTVAGFGKSDNIMDQTLYENNVRAVKARHPNVQSGGRNNYLFAEAAASPATNTSFKVKASDTLPAMASTADLDVYVWPGGRHPWEAKYRKVSSVNYSTRVITLSASTDNYNLDTGSMYYLEGAIELLDTPGEFFYDKAASTLYYYPRNSASLANGIFAPKRQDYADSIFRFEGGASNIVIEGLTMRNTAFDSHDAHQGFTAAVTIENGNHLTIRGNDFYSLGSSAVGFAGYRVTYTNIVIENNRMRDMGRGAVQVDRFSENVVNNVTIKNNYMYKGGQLKGDENAWQAWSRVDNLVFSYNRVDEWPRFATYFKGDVTNSRIEFNDISNCVYETQDAGPIYAYFTPNSFNKINNNALHDNNFNYGYDNNLIYLDDGADGYEIYNNVMYDNNKPGGGILAQAATLKGIGNKFYNNIVANNNIHREGGAIIASIAMAGKDNRDIDIRKNIFYNNQTNFYHFFVSWQNNRYAYSDYNLIFNPNNNPVLTWNGIHSPGTKTHNYGDYATIGFNMPNQSWDGDHDWGYYTMAYWRTVLSNKFDNNTLTQDPMFMDAAANDFRLKHDSPAYGLGFQDINLRDIGLTSAFPYANAEETLKKLFVRKSGDTVDKAKIELAPGGTAQLEVAGRTVTGYVANLTNASKSYASANTSVATVNASGVVTAVAAGTAKITTTVTKGGVTKTSDIYVIVSGSGGGGSGTLISQGKAVTSDSQESGYPASNAVDGNVNTKWDSADGGDHWLRVDLGANYNVDKFVVKHYGAAGGAVQYNTVNFKLQTSTDGTVWTDRATVTNNTSNITTHTIAPATARYVRLYTTSASQWDNRARIPEFEVYGTAASSQTGSLISQGKAVTADSQDGSFPSSNAVDGNVNTKWDSADGGDHWLRVDLGANYNVDKFVVKHYGAAGGAVQYNTVNFKLQTSTDGTVWTDRATVTNNTSNITTHTIAPATARYVRLYTTSASQWDNRARIPEFEVYGY